MNTNEQLAVYAKAIMERDAEIERLRSELRLIATPIRPDGTWNRDRKSCQRIAEKALIGVEE
jgi:hypothetical protein